MKIKIISVGKMKDARLAGLFKDYSKRISHDAKLEFLEIKDSCVEEEGKRIIEHLETIKDSFFIFALGEEGRQFTSVEFSEKIESLSNDGKTILFIIGGP